MRYCKNCGVELDEKMEFCPLCGKDEEDNIYMKPADYSSESDELDEDLLMNIERLTSNQKRKLFWELSGIILVSGIAVTLIIDLILNKSMTWSKYSITVSLVILVNTTVFTFLRKRIILRFLISFISTSLLLILIDAYYLNMGWGIKLGIPFLFSFYFISLILILVTKYTKQRGINILAFYFIGLGLFIMSIEGILSVYFDHLFKLHWSLIVFICLVPVTAVLFFIHYRLKKGRSLKKLFHI